MNCDLDKRETFNFRSRGNPALARISLTLPHLFATILINYLTTFSICLQKLFLTSCEALRISHNIRLIDCRRQASDCDAVIMLYDEPSLAKHLEECKWIKICSRNHNPFWIAETYFGSELFAEIYFIFIFHDAYRQLSRKK